MTEILEISFILILAAIKFAFAATYLIITKGFSYRITVLLLLIGGSVGVICFYFFGSWINKVINKFIRKRKKKKTKTKSIRLMIKIKNSYGLIGLAFLSPVLFSIPLGMFLATRFFFNNRLIIPYFIFAVVFWSLIFPLVTLYFNA